MEVHGIVPEAPLATEGSLSGHTVRQTSTLQPFRIERVDARLREYQVLVRKGLK